MSAPDIFDGPVPEIPRDRWGRPMVAPPAGGKPVAYTRCTTFVDCLEDKYNLQNWMKRMVCVGLSMRPDLLLAVSAHSDDKKRLDKIAEDALEAAKANAAATTGTALHSLTEKVDRGEELPVIPDAYVADLEAYRRTTALLNPVAIEQFTVYDPYRIGGTPDRVVNYKNKCYIADVKTGSIQWGMGKIAMQLAVYSRSTPYDFQAKTRTPWPVEVDQDRAIVIHLPAGEGRCELHWVDIDRGWRAVDLASQVRDWRSAKDLSTPFAIDLADPTDEIVASITECSTVTELRAAYAAAILAGVPEDKVLPACLARKAELEVAA